MSQEHLLEYNNLTKETIEQAKRETIEVTCLVPKGEDLVSRLLKDNGFKYIGKRLVDGEKLVVFRWFKALGQGYEDMANFFNRRADDYDTHMQDIDAYESSLRDIVTYLDTTEDAIRILDLGCGTGAD
jgi:hypothetical protein